MYRQLNTSTILRLRDFANIPVDPTNRDYVEYLAWRAAGGGPEAPPEVGPAVIKATLAAAVQAHLDVTAQTYGYDNIFTAVTYADEPAVPKFQNDGKALRAWRSSVWAACYSLIAEVEAGQRAVPTAAELLNLLPAAPVIT